MANPFRGYVDLEVEGKTYRLLMDYNAIAELDDKLGYSALGATEEQYSSIKFMRAALWACLQHDQRFARMTLTGAGKMMEKAGIGAVAAAVSKAIHLGFASMSGKDASAEADGDGPLEPVPSQSEP